MQKKDREGEGEGRRTRACFPGRLKLALELFIRENLPLACQQQAPLK